MSIWGDPVTFGSSGGGGGSTIISKTITQNGTYNASSDNADGYDPVTVNVSGAGGIESWDFTSATPYVGTLRGWAIGHVGTSIDQSGVIFNSASDYLTPGIDKSPITIELDIASMNLTPADHRRFIMGTETNGFIYRSTGVWAFYNGSWQDSNEMDGSFFSGSTIKIVIDSSNKWHIYKNGVLWWEPTGAQPITKLMIGSNEEQSINSVTINALRLMGGSSSGGGGGSNIIPKTITQNGTYNAFVDNADGYDPVTVHVTSGGDVYPFWTDVYDTSPFPTGVTVSASITKQLIAPSWVSSASQNVEDFVNNSCRISTRSSASATTTTASITRVMAEKSLSQVLADESIFNALVEYYGNLYNNALLTTYNMVLLGDFSQGGAASGNALSDAITNYTAIALNGIYKTQRTSNYNTTIIYVPELNVAKWTGMKDRNSLYDCYVTFTDAQTVSLSGNKQVIIYGIP